MEFDLSSIAGNLNFSQRQILEKNLLESSFKKLIASEKLFEPNLEILKAKIEKIPNLKVKFLAHLATMKEDYIQVLLHLMKMRQDPKYSPAMLDAANQRDWPTLAHLCQK